MTKNLIKFVVGLVVVIPILFLFVKYIVPFLDRISPMLAIFSIMFVCSMSFMVLWFNTFGAKDNTENKEVK